MPKRAMTKMALALVAAVAALAAMPTLAKDRSDQINHCLDNPDPLFCHPLAQADAPSRPWETPEAVAPVAIPATAPVTASGTH